MRGVLRPSVLVLALLLFPMVGCETSRIWLDLPSFSANAIEGVWLWKWSELDSRYERACRLPFSAIPVSGGPPKLSYFQECEEGQPDMEFTTDVEYPAPDTVRIGLYYLHSGEPGTFKITSYGARGESSLSATTLEL